MRIHAKDVEMDFETNSNGVVLKFKPDTIDHSLEVCLENSRSTRTLALSLLAHLTSLNSGKPRDEIYLAVRDYIGDWLSLDP